jgi:hypothetical protein
MNGLSMTSPSDQPGIPPNPPPEPVPVPRPMPEEAPGYDAPVPVADPPTNPDTPGLPGGDPEPGTPGISDPAPMTN